MIRGGALHLVAHMRSNDVYKGLPHDVFCFTMLQEVAARSLGVELGHYSHSVGSLHLYKDDASKAERYLSEGWHQKVLMPPMPSGDQMGNIAELVAIEERIRVAGESPTNNSLNSYWQDIALLLDAFSSLARSPSDSHSATLRAARERVQSEAYRRYLLDREHQAEEKP
jgi:thymidylate synthase